MKAANQILINMFSRRMISCASIIAAACGCFLQDLHAQQTLPFYEPFNYTDGTALGGTGGGSAVWTVGNGVGAGGATNRTGAALSYSGLAESSGIGLQSSTGTSRNRGVVFTQQVLGAGNPSVYVSFLIQRQNTSSGNKTLMYLRNSTSGGTPHAGVFINSSDQLQISKNSGTPAAGATPALNAGQTYFAVLRYQWSPVAGNADQVALWLDPSTGDFGADEGSVPAPTLSITNGSDQTSLEALFIAGLVSDPSVQYIDELRIGQTWASVTPGGTCNPVQVTSGATPSSVNVNVGDTANFSITATGSSRTHFWQESTDGNNWDPASGATDSPNYTTPALFLSDNGKQYRCVVSNSCDDVSYTSVSGVATVSVQDLSIVQFRSANGGGNWNSTGSWEQSTDGNNWSPAGSTPSSANSTITIRSGNPITVTANVTADQVTVEAGATLEAGGGILTIADGPDAVDCNVLGTLRVADVAGSYVTNALGAAGITIANGGQFVWARSSDTIRIPIATWADGSICEVQAGGNGTPANLNQNYYDFTWSKTSSGAVNLGGQLTTVRRNLTMSGSGDVANSVRFLGSGITCNLNVGGDFVAQQGYITLSGGSANGTVLNLTVSGNFTINGGATLDSRTGNASTLSGNEVNIIFDNTGTPQTLNFTGDIGHSGAVLGCPINWKIQSGVTVTVTGGNIKLGNAYLGTTDTVTVDGTLDCDGNQIVGTASPSGAITINGGGTIVGEGTTQIASGLATVNYGGTLSLPNLPGTLNNGDNFLLFGANSYSGAFGSITPATTPVTGFGWDDSQMTVSGTLYVGSAVVPVLNISSISRSGSDLRIIGTGGTANGSFNVLISSSVSAPVGTWSIYTSGNFDGSGNFDLTFPAPGTSPSFFVVQE
ncbi:MAG TPA: hypothetical protein PKA41_06750 [Verrucomicrobiota bacterium]|nr:hypothetical protein [Verrucomicrobiota bacterium]